MDEQLNILDRIHASYYQLSAAERKVADYVLQQCLSQYSARDLCAAGLEKLLRYDASHPEMELAKTLEMYYNCKFNAAEAAKKLYIHRTTMFYRLNKIQEIADIDHDNPEVRLHLMLSFALLREEQIRTEHIRCAI